jgi:exodeoxyribonuclease V gamma subunit
MTMKVFTSNHLEILAELLKEELFLSSRHPLDKRWVVVPNERVKEHLFLRWASDPALQVAAGFKMITWCEALSRLFPDLPSQTALSLKIEAAIDLIAAEPLRSYLNDGGAVRKASLCDQMSSLFSSYLQQPEEKLLAWLRQRGWQQELWNAVFTGQPWKNQKSFEGSVYLFNPFHLSPYQLQAFKKMGASCFLFSPCALYWGDLKTFREQGQIMKRAPRKTREELLLNNESPLLANWGRKGRQLLALFEDEECFDAYAEIEAGTLLKTVQSEILTLSTLEKKQDASIQVHSATSKLREVEVVWEIIQRLPFESREILVLAPAMQSYAATVEMVFRQRGGPFDFAIYCLEARSKSPLMQGMQDLLELPRYRFSAESLEKLLFCPAFLSRFKIEIDEAHRLQEWVGRVKIRYDLQGEHPCTWEAGLKRLVEALVATAREDRLSIPFSESDLLSSLISIIELFKQELTVIQERQSTVQEWVVILKSWVEKFFTADPDDHLMRELDRLSHLQVEGRFPFASMERVLQSIFNQNTGAVQGSHLQAVRFASLEKGALIPAKAVILMGMEEGSFPRQDPPSSLQQLPVLSRAEEDRYLFLEALCSAREMFILTYTRLHPEDGKSQKPCSMVEELQNYCALQAIDHPFSPFDTAYFQKTGFQSYSRPHFEALAQKPREQEAAPLPEIGLPAISIGVLRKLARHPLQYFFEERLGIDFEWSEPETEFTLPPLELSRLRKLSLRKPLNEILDEMESQGKFPVGAFKDVAVQKIQAEIADYHEALQTLQVNPDEVYSIEFKTSCAEPVQIDRTWIYPALHIDGTVIQGRIDELSPQGLLVHGDDTLPDLLKAWPAYLIANLVKPLPLLLTKKGKASKLQLENPREALERYLRYAKKALTEPSPLHPKWARGIFKEGKISSSPDEDEITAWARGRSLLPPADAWTARWRPYLQEVFRELL